MKYSETYICKNGVELIHIYSDTYYLLNENGDEFSDVYDPIDSTHTYEENTSHRLNEEEEDDV